MMRKVINDPTIEVIPNNRIPGPAPRLHGSTPKSTMRSKPRITGLPRPDHSEMSTGATDMAFLRAKGMQCYGVGIAADRRISTRASPPTATRNGSSSTPSISSSNFNGTY